MFSVRIFTYHIVNIGTHILLYIPLRPTPFTYVFCTDEFRCFGIGGSLPVSSVRTFVSLRVRNDCADASSSLLYWDDCSVILVFSQTSCGRISERNSVGLFLGCVVSSEMCFHQLGWNDVPCATCRSGARVGFVGNLSKFSILIFLKKMNLLVRRLVQIGIFQNYHVPRSVS